MAVRRARLRVLRPPVGLGLTTALSHALTLCAGALGAAITAASLSFADAGIELYDVATACSVVRVVAHVQPLSSSHVRVLCHRDVRVFTGTVQASHKGTLLLDPTASEAERCTATTTMAVMPALGEVRPSLPAVGKW